MKSYHKDSSDAMVAIKNPERLWMMAEKGLMNLSIELGLEVLQQILEYDADELAGPKGKHSRCRQAYRHGKEQTSVTLGGQKVKIRKPRVRSLDNQELSLKSLSLFQNGDPLDESVLARLLSGVSCRKYERTLDPANVEGKGSTSKSTVQRRFSQAMERAMKDFFNRQLTDDFPVLMLDGVCLSEITVVAAMGITKDGHKKILGIIEGGSENHVIVKNLLADLIERGLDPNGKRLVVLDGSKALHKAVTETLGRNVRIQRCQIHKKRNVLSHLPQSEQTNIGFAISRAYLEFDGEKAMKELKTIASNLENRYPKAAASLLEGLEETLTVHRLKIPGTLRVTLSNTNALESANSVSMRTSNRVSRYKDGEHALRWMAAGFLEAEAGFRRIKGYKQLAVLITNLDAEITEHQDSQRLSQLA
jgi:transposase-like protein